MSRINTIDPTHATGKAKELLDAVKGKLGMVPNMMRAMANSPVVLQSYLQFSDALNHGVLSPKLREQLALAVAQANGCEYCLSAHSVLGKKAGLNDTDIVAARKAGATDAKAEAAVRFGVALAKNRGSVSDTDFARLREFGYTDAEISEIIAVVSLNVFTNYFNTATNVDIDFPRAAVAV